MKIDGGCHCGAVTYQAVVDPEKVMICHCTDCQTLSGSAFRTVVLTTPGGLTLTGTVTVYMKTGETGARRQQAFCPGCGSPIYSTSEGGDPKVYSIRAGTIRQRDELVPKAQIWTRSSQRWLGTLSSIPGHLTQAVTRW